MPSLSHRRAFRVRSFSAAVACTASLSLFGSSAIGQASPKDSLQPAVAELISTITESESELNNLDLRIGELRESVNEALLILQDARSEAAQAERGVSSAKEELDVAQADIADAQDELDELSRAKYRRAAGSASLAEISNGDRRDDELYRKTFLRAQADEKLATIDELDRVRTEKANKESQLRKTHELAEQRAEQANDAETQARELLERTTAQVTQLQQQRAEVAEEHKESQQELAAARGNSTNRSAASDTSPSDQQPVDRQTAGDSPSGGRPAEDGSSTSEDEQVEHTQTNRAEKDSGNHPAEAVSDTAEALSPELTELIEQAANEVAEHLPDHTALDSVTPDTSTTEQTVQDPPGQIPALQRVEESTPRTQLNTEPAESLTDTATGTGTSTGAEAEGEAASAQNQVASEPTDSSTNQQDAASESAGAGSEDSTDESESTGDQLVNELSGVLDELDTNTTVTEDASANFAEVGSSQQAQAVLSRARSQLGVDYAWGGGNAQGPTAGIRDGANADSNGDFGKVGFDCSGLVQYAFAGAGISLPHYSGGQYRHGTHVSTSDLQPGDLIFYGPGGSQHVAIYSGNGMMIEAPHSGSQVREVPVRHSGMTENAVRLLG